MKGIIEDRAIVLGEYISSTGATVRDAAKKFHVSKSTVHKDVTEKLKESDIELWKMVKVVLDRNKRERHIRGGLATRKKYKGI